MKTARASPPSRGEPLLSLLSPKTLCLPVGESCWEEEPPPSPWAGCKAPGSPQPLSVFVLLQPAPLEPLSRVVCGAEPGVSCRRSCGPAGAASFLISSPGNCTPQSPLRPGVPVQPGGGSPKPGTAASRSQHPTGGGEQPPPRSALSFLHPSLVNPCLFPLASQTEGQTPPRPMSPPSNYSCSRAAVHGGGAALRG